MKKYTVYDLIMCGKCGKQIKKVKVKRKSGVALKEEHLCEKCRALCIDFYEKKEVNLGLLTFSVRSLMVYCWVEGLLF